MSVFHITVATLCLKVPLVRITVLFPTVNSVRFHSYLGSSVTVVTEYKLVGRSSSHGEVPVSLRYNVLTAVSRVAVRITCNGLQLKFDQRLSTDVEL
jgi:hypothetical protein